MKRSGIGMSPGGPAVGRGGKGFIRLPERKKGHRVSEDLFEVEVVGLEMFFSPFLCKRKHLLVSLCKSLIICNICTPFKGVPIMHSSTRINYLFILVQLFGDKNAPSFLLFDQPCFQELIQGDKIEFGEGKVFQNIKVTVL